CLQKDPRERLRDIGDARIEVKQALSEPPTVLPIGVISAAQPARWKLAIPWGVAGLTTAALLISLVVLWPTPPVELTPVRLHVQLPPDQSINTTSGSAAILSPDGKRLAYVARCGGTTQLYVRALDQLEGTVLSGTEGAEVPFFSPDGQWVGFAAGGQLKKVSVSGGAVVTLCAATNMNGASWGPDDTIIFTPSSNTGLFRVPAAGGTPEEITVPDLEKGEPSHRYPQILPGSHWVPFSAGVTGSFHDANVVVRSLETGERKVVHRGSYYPHYVPTGHLVFMHEATLFAAPFDLDRLELTGSPAPILEGVLPDPVFGEAQFAFSQTGTLIYLPGGEGGGGQRSLVWVDREGNEEPLAAEPRTYRSPRLSPDGSRLAIDVVGRNTDVWIYDLAHDTSTRLTFDPAVDAYPLWTPDGLRVMFRSNREVGQGLFWKAADGTGQVERLTTSLNFQYPHSFAPDGKRLVFVEWNPETSYDIHMLSTEGEPAAKPLLQTQFNEGQPAISPDGQWIAYQSNESGRQEVYVRPFPNVEEGKRQISSDGGRETIWGPQGQKLFYRSLNGQEVMVVSIKTEPTFTRGNPEVLFTGSYFSGFGRDYDISPDGQRFLMMKAGEQTEESSAPTQLIVVLNWFDELKRLVPTDK
ncbi:hypothetical protein MYX78_12555, partial [Acidobacteria bacterium AH-259-G07]|nr:hypothetical protein [Acidobacteria bacterium AH-259-G07]